MGSQQQLALISPVSRGIQQRVVRQLQLAAGATSSSKQQQQQQQDAFTEVLHEFDGCKYMLCGAAAGNVLALSYAQPGECTQQALDNLASLFAGIATLVTPAEPGFQCTLAIDMRMLARLPETEQAYWVDALASLRLFVSGAPLRHIFAQLADGTIREATAVPLSNKPGQVYFVKPHDDSVTVVLPIRFVSSQDAAIGHALLQEFVEARRSASLGRSPTVTYHPAKAPPLELQGAPIEQLVQGCGDQAHLVPRGYMCLKFFQRHVAAPTHLEHVVWSVMTFNTLIAFHIKACKAAMHTQMRKKIDRLLHDMPKPVPQSLYGMNIISTTPVPAGSMVQQQS